ncbi:ribonuclease H-like domain-containing protein, partial [Tanacetum coccineum]
MHVEKNVVESLVGTLLHVLGKTKDGVNARLDLAEFGVKPELFAMEVELCGSICFRWMYPFKRCMKVIKGHVRNRNRPEGCIPEETKIINISSDNSNDSRWAAKKASAPVFYGPSTQGLLDSYGYNTIEEYLSWNYFPSINKRNTDKDCIVDSNSAMSKGKYVPVCKKNKPNVYSHVQVTGYVLGLPNVTTWDEIEKKMGARKSKTYADKAKGKRKVSSCTLHLQLAYAQCIGTLHLQLVFASKHLQIAYAHCICTLHLQASICTLHLQS